MAKAERKEERRKEMRRERIKKRKVKTKERKMDGGEKSSRSVMATIRYKIQ